MSHICATSIQLPKHYYSQREITDAFLAYWGKEERALNRIHKSVQVSGRYLAMPMEDYITLSSFKERNDVWKQIAFELGEKAVLNALQVNDTSPNQISLLAFTTVTGLAVPSIDAKLMNRIPFKSNLKRLPLFGLGCVAGAAGIARVHDYLKGHPDERAMLLSVELCSLTVQKDDLSIENIVSSGLFGDGAACVLMSGTHVEAKSKGPQIIDTYSELFPDTEYVMGWDFRGSGFKIVLSADVPKMAREKLPQMLNRFLQKNGLTLKDIDRWICHPGGPKVINAIEESLNLPEGELDITRDSLRNIGNLSSASVLAILDSSLKLPPPLANGYGLILAMGPGFCAEAILIQY